MATALAIGGGALSAYGNIQQGIAGEDAANQNAGIEEGNARFAREAGEDRAKMLLRQGSMFRSSIRNRASASGLVADTGSPLLVQEEALYESGVDANKARYAASVQAYGHSQRANLYRKAGRQALMAGYFGAAGSLLSGGGGAMRAGKA